jgi:hypothetical protein
MKLLLFIERCVNFCCRKYIKWPLLISATVIITAVHFIMYDRMHDPAHAPSWQFTLALHTAMALAAGLAIVWYKKYVKRKLTNHEKSK